MENVTHLSCINSKIKLQKYRDGKIIKIIMKFIVKFCYIKKIMHYLKSIGTFNI